MVYIVWSGATLSDLTKVLARLPRVQRLVVNWMGNEYEIGIGEDVLRTALRLASQAASTAHFVALASGKTWKYEGDTLATFEAFRKSSYPAMLQEAMSFPNLTLCSGITDFRGLVTKDSRGHFGGESKDQLIAIICKWLRADGVKPRHTALPRRT